MKYQQTQAERFHLWWELCMHGFFMSCNAWRISLVMMRNRLEKETRRRSRAHLLTFMPISKRKAILLDRSFLNLRWVWMKTFFLERESSDVKGKLLKYRSKPNWLKRKLFIREKPQFEPKTMTNIVCNKLRFNWIFGVRFRRLIVCASELISRSFKD